MTVLITLTTLGIDTGPLFNLSSSPDGTTFTQFATGIAKLVLEGGYSATVPDGTTTIRVTSTGVCTNYEDITISGLDCGLVATAVVSTPATTTTTTTIVNYPFSLIAGTVGCDGSITFTPIGVITAYSDSPTLEIGVTLYTAPNLITPITYEAVKSGVQIYELVDGQILQILTVGSAC